MKVRILFAAALTLGLAACSHHAPPPPPPPPPPPAPVMHYEDVTVFFDFEKANLTGRAADAVADFVAREHHVPHHAVVIGYCDTAEHHRHDLALRRAETVKDELVRRGMDAGSIDVRASDDLMVKTGDHTREPQNRRVVISH